MIEEWSDTLCLFRFGLHNTTNDGWISTVIASRNQNWNHRSSTTLSLTFINATGNHPASESNGHVMFVMLPLRALSTYRAALEPQTNFTPLFFCTFTLHTNQSSRIEPALLGPNASRNPSAMTREFDYSTPR